MAGRTGAGWLAVLVLVVVLAGCAERAPVAVAPAPEPPPRVQKGVASWYGPGFHGRRTASGERFNQNGMTAAHRSLPLGTLVTVRNLENGRSVRVRINDRGPYKRGRVIDLSHAAARQLGIVDDGIAQVALEWSRADSSTPQTAMAED